jgi:hypothetical protein
VENHPFSMVIIEVSLGEAAMNPSARHLLLRSELLSLLLSFDSF